MIGIVNEFSFRANVYRDHRGLTDLAALGLLLAETSCCPLCRRHGSLDREVAAAVAAWSVAQPD